ncbi:host attachment protein [Methylobacillus sp. Pita2]|uniref:host attachment protein n=1 Tax=Methylobacillus sp. Pita2 TaxID=3383245 RepID=UPI0038B59C7D
MDTTWILVADSSRARIFEMQAHHAPTEIMDLRNGAGQLQNRELRTDGKGRFFGSAGTQGNTYEPVVTPKVHEASLFAEEVNQYLTEHYNHHHFSRLQVIAQPKFLGLLRDKLNDQVRKLVVEEVSKDLSKASVEDIQQQVSNLH